MRDPLTLPSLPRLRVVQGTTLAFLFGIIRASQKPEPLLSLPPPTFLYLWGLLILLPLLLRFYQPAPLNQAKTWLKLSLILLLGGSAGFLFTHYWRARHWADTPQGAALVFTGVVAEPPDIRSDAVFLTVQPLQGPAALAAFIRHKSRILVKADRYPVYTYGQELKVEGTLVRPESIEAFNYPLYLERYRIYARTSPVHLSPLPTLQGNPWRQLLYGFRQEIEYRINHFLPEPEAGFLGGILLGSKRSVPEEIQSALRTTGTSHIIAISGANITILLGILLRLLPLYRQRSQLLCVSLLSLIMASMTGASASVVRGGLLASLSMLLKLVSRRAWPTSFILGGMLLMLLSNPLLLVADPGFQLSFAAFAGLAYLSLPLTWLVERNRFLSALPEVMRASLVETAAATLGTLPVSLAVFQQVSFLGLIVNPLVLWLLPPITFLGLLLLLFGSSPALGFMISLPLWFLLHSSLALIQWFGQYHFALLQHSLAWSVAGLLALLLTLLTSYLSRRFTSRVSLGTLSL